MKQTKGWHQFEEGPLSRKAIDAPDHEKDMHSWLEIVIFKSEATDLGLMGCLNVQKHP